MRRLSAVLALSLAAACSHHAASSTPASSPDDAAPARAEPAAKAEPREKAEPKVKAEPEEKPAAAAKPAPVHEGKQRGALAQIESRSGSKLVGTARFTAKEGGVVMHLVIAGATAGEHTVVIHETGDCGGANADNAGGVFSPEGGAQFGNVKVDASGNGSLDVTVPGITISGAGSGIAGRAIVIHGGADDQRASSPRLGCGVIKAE